MQPIRPRAVIAQPEADQMTYGQLYRAAASYAAKAALDNADIAQLNERRVIAETLALSLKSDKEKLTVELAALSTKNGDMATELAKLETKFTAEEKVSNDLKTRNVDLERRLYAYEVCERVTYRELSDLRDSIKDQLEKIVESQSINNCKSRAEVNASGDTTTDKTGNNLELAAECLLNAKMTPESQTLYKEAAESYDKRKLKQEATMCREKAANASLQDSHSLQEIDDDASKRDYTQRDEIDYDSVAENLERAAICLQSANKLSESRNTYIEAADNYDKQGLSLHAAKCRELAADMCKSLQEESKANDGNHQLRSKNQKRKCNAVKKPRGRPPKKAK